MENYMDTTCEKCGGAMEITETQIVCSKCENKKQLIQTQ